MSNLSYRFAKALAAGRAHRPKTREGILSSLLAKRAAAQRAGLTELEEQLRNQIRWALPMRSGDSSPEADEE